MTITATAEVTRCTGLLSLLNGSDAVKQERRKILRSLARTTDPVLHATRRAYLYLATVACE